ncbi:MAG: lipocalin-like domain-containing protein [Candidatus Acidiferrum sp.]
MKSKLACLAAFFLMLQPLAAQYRTALPGYNYEFPRDHFNHPEFQTEWWYYTGNLRSVDGHRFGFELTFFRQAVARNTARENSQTHSWDVDDLYLAHLALSDLDGGAFYHFERINRAGPGLAGISSTDQRVWNGNWQVHWNAETQELQATEARFQLQLALRSLKPPVIHGENGISQKSAGAGHASHYISLTRLETHGTIELKGKKIDVAGVSWMDHEFFTQQLAGDQAGWDWLSLQLDDNTEVMLYRFRRKDGSADPYSAGTFIDAAGKSFHLRSADFILQPQRETFTSPETRAIYPIHWKIVIPKLEINLEAVAPLASQELAGKTKLAPSYWEGAIKLSGQRGDQPIAGVGYLEMTGYDHPARLAPEDSVVLPAH